MHTGMSFAEGYLFDNRPKMRADGNATIWVTRSASKRPVVSSPSAVP